MTTDNDDRHRQSQKKKNETKKKRNSQMAEPLKTAHNEFNSCRISTQWKRRIQNTIPHQAGTDGQGTACAAAYQSAYVLGMEYIEMTSGRLSGLHRLFAPGQPEQLLDVMGGAQTRCWIRLPDAALALPGDKGESDNCGTVAMVAPDENKGRKKKKDWDG